MTIKKELIYLADLDYRLEGSVFPLSVGFMQSTIESIFPGQFEVKIFVEPLKLYHSLKDNPPRMLGLANYAWNRNINSKFTEIAKKISSKTITLMGGPCFAKNDVIWMSNFFKHNPSLDFYVAGEGEWRLVDLIRQGLANGYDISLMKRSASPNVFFADEAFNIHEGKQDAGYKDRYEKILDKIPSPYLTGIMDQFLSKEEMVPLIETVRGCPYACTFCCWGDPSLNRLTSFSVERVKEEVDYIAKNTKNHRLIMADGNFGILPRDYEIAQYLRQTSDRTGWPNNIYLYFAKNSNDRIVNIAAELGHLITMSMSRQTLNKDVLTNIKRANVSDETFEKILAQLNQKNIESKVELIYPLPGESRETFLAGLNQIFKQIDVRKTEMRIYPTELLPGAEMSMSEERKKYGMKTAWRIYSGYSGQFDDISVSEYQEVIIGTNTFTPEDFFYVRELHFLIYLFVTYKVFHSIMSFFIEHDLERNPSVFYDKIISGIQQEGGLIKEFFDELQKEFRKEFVTPEEYESMTEYKAVESRRINIYYILKLLYGKSNQYRYAFYALLKKIFINDYSLAPEQVEGLIGSSDNNIIDFVQFEKWHKQGILSEKLKDIPHDSFVMQHFIKYYNGDLVDTLDILDRTAYAAYLGKLVLKNQGIADSDKVAV